IENFEVWEDHEVGKGGIRHTGFCEQERSEQTRRERSDPFVGHTRIIAAETRQRTPLQIQQALVVEGRVVRSDVAKSLQRSECPHADAGDVRSRKKNRLEIWQPAERVNAGITQLRVPLEVNTADLWEGREVVEVAIAKIPIAVYRQRPPG